MNGSIDNQPHARSQRVMVYCHDSVGVGHLRRTLAIAEHIGRMHTDASFLLATGTPYVPLFDSVPRVDYVKLPALAKSADGTYGSRSLNIPLERLIRCREALLLQTVESFEPDVLLIDKAPVGVCRELIPTLKWLRAHRPDTHVVFGMRDIEDDAERTRAQWNRDGVIEALERFFDEVWVYGMREVYDPVRAYRLPRTIEDKLSFMGYVARGVCDHDPTARPQRRNVLVTVGGGTDGAALLETYLEEAAGRAAGMNVDSVIIGGPDLPEAARNRLRSAALATEGVEWVDFESCMSCRIAQADLVVSMGGYNTLCEIAARRKPSLIVPRVEPRREQAIRARLWAERGGLFALDPNQLTPRVMADRVSELLRSGPPTMPAALDMNGLDRIGERFDAIWSEVSHDATAIRV